MTLTARYHRAVILAALGVLCAAPSAAQTLRGTILDSDSGEPVSLAYVGLLAEGRELVVAALAGNDGAFSLEAPSAGSFFVLVSRTGYDTLMDGVFDLGEGGVLDLRIGLQPAPIALDPLTVEGARLRSPLEVSGFYERAALGRGHFQVRNEIERVTVERISDAFRGIPRLRIRTDRPLTGGPEAMAPPALIMRSGGGECRPTLYVDRTVAASGLRDPVRPDDFVAPHDVEAIEVYTRANDVPFEFSPINDCGVVIIWTRTR